MKCRVYTVYSVHCRAFTMYTGQCCHPPVASTHCSLHTMMWPICTQTCECTVHKTTLMTALENTRTSCESTGSRWHNCPQSTLKAVETLGSLVNGSLYQIPCLNLCKSSGLWNGGIWGHCKNVSPIFLMFVGKERNMFNNFFGIPPIFK